MLSSRAGATPLADYSVLLVVGTPTVRPADVARLARAYYHDDLQLIDETSVRGEDGRWRYRDPRMRAEWRMHSRARSSRECAHRNRPLRYDGRVVVTLCAEEIGYLPVTTEITSLPQLTSEGLPLALARRAAEATRMANAVAELEACGEAVTSRALAAAARISPSTACTWLRQRENGTLESETMLSTLHYSSHSTPDNIPATENSASTQAPAQAQAVVDPPAVAPVPRGAESLSPVLPRVCLAASHQLRLPLERGRLAMSSMRRVARASTARIRGQQPATPSREP